jgi:hypothetical protein
VVYQPAKQVIEDVFVDDESEEQEISEPPPA